MGWREPRHAWRRELIDKARLLGYEIKPSPNLMPHSKRYALMRDFMWVQELGKLDVPTFRFMWEAAEYVLKKEGIDVSPPYQTRDT
jgi:hypothetical protein